MRGRDILATALLLGLSAAATAQDRPTKTAVTQGAVPDGYASGVLTIGKRTVTIRFVPSGETAALFLDSDTPLGPQEVAIADVDIALRVLSDRRLAFLAPALKAWAGPGLIRLRDRMVERTRATYRNGDFPDDPKSAAQHFVRPRVRALMQYADALTASGRRDEAVALIEQARSAIKLKKPGWSSSEWTMMSLRQASYLRDRQAPDAEIAALAAASARIGGDSPYHINFDINRAARLAETGQYAEALALIDSAETAFVGTAGPRLRDGGNKLPGSLREFAWIRACALHGLGRVAEAAALLARITDETRPSFPDTVAPPGPDFTMRVAACLRDKDAMVRVLADDIDRDVLAPTGLVWLQGDLHPDTVPADLVAAVRADLLARPEIAARFRPVGPAMRQALNRWRDGPGS